MCAAVSVMVCYRGGGGMEIFCVLHLGLWFYTCWGKRLKC